MNERLLQPLYKGDSNFSAISFANVFSIIENRLKVTAPLSTLFIADGTLSNEELYLIQRWARGGVKSNALATFDYLGRDENFNFDKNDIVPFAELAVSSHLFFLNIDDSSKHYEYLKILEIAKQYNLPFSYLNKNIIPTSVDYFAFFRCVNHYLLKNNRVKGVFVEGIGKNFLQYKEKILKENFQQLLETAKTTENVVIQFIELILKEENPVFIYQEKNLSSRAIYELINFAMLIEIQTKTGSGLLGLKQNRNSQGLFDMGFFPLLAPSGEKWEEESVKLAENLWKTTIQYENIDVFQLLKMKKFQNVLIFGNSAIENPILSLIDTIPFKVVQTSVVGEMVDFADILLPASYPQETGGIYTDSTRMAHVIEKKENSPISFDNLQQLNYFSELFGLPPLNSQNEIFLEYASFFKPACNSAKRHFFTI